MISRTIQLVARLSRKWQFLKASYESTNARWENLR